MSSVYLHVGQCGNQLGKAFWAQVAQATDCDSAYESSFFDTIHLPSLNGDPGDFKRISKARAILVDSEPKVVTTTCKLRRRGGRKRVKDFGEGAGNDKEDAYREKPQLCGPDSIIRQGNAHVDQQGRGNNWAMGYNGARRDEGKEGSLSANTLESLRKEVERLDCFQGLTMMHSVSGGTGSGLGSRLAEEYRAQYGSKPFLISCVVTPFDAGETPLQHLNSALSFAHLQHFSDCVLLMSNEDVFRALEKTAAREVARGKKGGAKSFSFDSVNDYMAACLAGIFAPTVLVHPVSQPLSPPYIPGEDKRVAPSSLSSPRGPRARRPASIGSLFKAAGIPRPPRPFRPFCPYELVQSVCPISSAKFVEVWTTMGLSPAIPRPSKWSLPSLPEMDWDSLGKRLQAILPLANMGVGNRAIASQLLARGDDDGRFAQQLPKLDKLLHRLLSPVDWNPYPLDVLSTAYPPLPLSLPRPASPSKVCSPKSGAKVKTKGKGSTPRGRSLTLVTNRGSVQTHLSSCLSKACKLVDAQAYLHWYKRYGVEVEDIDEALETVHGICQSYSQLCT